tara:strand:- start:1103 stop:1303 length:201 start_codon:yes stop_codon:yes gene_type:complete
MRIDDDRDLAEQVESALRALGIAATRSHSERPQSIVDAVSALRRDNGLPRIEVLDAPARHEVEERP